MSNKVIDIVGLKVGSFTVIVRHHTHESGHIYWLCRCECGDIKLVRGVRLRNGEVIRCLACNPTQEKKYASEKKHKFERRIKNIYYGMNARCKNKNQEHYHLYGGRGIKVCEEWSSFGVFRKWALANGYSQKLTLDRIESNGHYTPDNCKWSTTLEQERNREFSIRMPNGEYIKDYCKKHGVPYMTFYRRYKILKWDMEKSATYPVKKSPRWHTEDGTIKKVVSVNTKISRKRKKSLKVLTKEQSKKTINPPVVSTNEWEALLVNIGYA